MRFEVADAYQRQMGRRRGPLALLFLEFAGTSQGERICCGTGSLAAATARSSAAAIFGIGACASVCSRAAPITGPRFKPRPGRFAV
jgi:hypothetical protein